MSVLLMRAQGPQKGERDTDREREREEEREEKKKDWRETERWHMDFQQQ